MLFTMDEEARLKRNEYQRKWAAKHPEKVRGLKRKYYVENRAEIRVNQAEYYKRHSQEVRLKVFAHYGPNGEIRCSWPGCEWTDVRALSIDHVNGGGNKHRETLGFGYGGGGWYFYAWLIREGYPEGYQTLCMNHQFVKERGG